MLIMQKNQQKLEKQNASLCHGDNVDEYLANLSRESATAAEPFSISVLDPDAFINAMSLHVWKHHRTTHGQSFTLLVLRGLEQNPCIVFINVLLQSIIVKHRSGGIQKVIDKH